MQLQRFFRFFSCLIFLFIVTLSNCSERQHDVFSKIKEEKDEASKCTEYIAKILIIRVIINIDNENKKCLEEIEHFSSKHNDIKKRVQFYINKSLLRHYNAFYTQRNTCAMSLTLHGSNLLYPANFNDSLLTFTSSSPQSFSFDKSCWMGWRNIMYIRDGNEEIIKTMFFNFGRHQQSIRTMIFDGLNKQDNFVIAINSTQELNKSNLFVANIEDLSSDESRIEPFKKIDANINAIMLHPTHNIVVYSSSAVKNDEDNDVYALHIFNPFDESLNVSSPVDFGCKKISFFGGGTCIFLTLQGQLGMCWLEKEKNNELAIKLSLKKHESTYIDFAPDTSVITKSGFARHWAFLTDKGEIFMCDFLNTLVDKPTLFLAIQADEPTKRVDENSYKLYYNNGTCGIVDTYKGTSADKFIIYS